LKLYLLAGLMLLGLIAAACGGGNSNVPPTHIPTRIPPTPTERSTPLPDVPDAPALGQEDRQITILFALFGDQANDSAKRAGIDLHQSLLDELDLDVNIEFVDENAALEAVCSGAPDVVWVSAFSYVAAQTQCEVVPALAVKRGRSPRISIGTTAELIGRSDINGVSELKGKVFCRSDKQDLFTSWIFPSLMMASRGVDPMLDLSAVQDYPDDLAVGRALYEDKCAAAALPPDQFEDFLIDLANELSTDEQPVTTSDLSKVVKILSPAGDTSAPTNESTWPGFGSGVVPYEALVFPPDSALPKEMRDQVTQVIADFFNDRTDGTQRLRALLDATGIMRVGSKQYETFRSTVVNSKWDMAFSE
jgi:ABC-type phosphate/phosphonate transport system substrate-binding protein